MTEAIFQERDDLIDAYEQTLTQQVDFVFGQFLGGVSDDPRAITFDVLLLLLLDQNDTMREIISSIPFRQRAEVVAQLVADPPDKSTRGLESARSSLVQMIESRVVALAATLTAKAQEMAATGRRDGFVEASGNLISNMGPALVQDIHNALLVWDRIVLEKIAETFDAPPMYIYAGPRDEKNRPFCADVVGSPPRTREQIEELNNHPDLHKYVPPNVFTLCGGINCRHVWLPVQ